MFFHRLSEKIKTLFSNNNSISSGTKRHPGWRIVLFVFVLAAIVATVFFLKAGSVFNKISIGEDGFLKGIVKSLPGTKETLVGEEEGKINILLLGMRGEKVVGGGLLADTIMVLSLHPSQGEGDTARASLVSIPRDFYVTVPGKSEQRKINAVYALGEERDHGKGGIEDMEKIVSEITGLTLSYSVVINFEGFKQLVDALGGITVTLAEPFVEGVQFRGLEQRCDGVVYTVPSGNYEEKRIQRKNGTYYANPKRYPLCFAKLDPSKLECEGNFKLPAGENMLDGETALCYARSRYTSNDFERARRQQQVIQAMKDKALSLGTLTDFGKINSILDSLGENVRTNLELWEMKRLLELSQNNPNPSLTQKVLENSEEGLLYAPEETKEAGYILLPRSNNYDQIRALFQGLP